MTVGVRWGWGREGGGTRTSCYVKTNLNRGKQCLRPPLKVLQVVNVSDIFKLRVMEAISFAQCERSSAISSCLSDSQWGMYKDKCVLSATLRKKCKINVTNVTDATKLQFLTTYVFSQFHVQFGSFVFVFKDQETICTYAGIIISFPSQYMN